MWISLPRMNNLMTQLGEPLYRKLEPTGYSNREHATG